MKYILSLVLLLYCIPSQAQPLPEPLLEALPQPLKSPLPAPKIAVSSWVLADFESGWIIDSVNAEARIEPASLTKLMTGYLVFDALSKEQIGLRDPVYISKKAWKTGGSRMFAEVDTRVAVEDLLRGLVIQSGNDAAVALAEHLGGSETGFAAKMNQTAAELGMHDTQFVNSNGLPNPQHYSSALDMTILTRALIRQFPDYYRFYSEKEYTYNGITQQNRNLLLWRDPSVDGIKTGYTAKAGYCLIGTARRDGMRLIATVIGSKSAQARADQVLSLLQYGYAAYESRVVYRPGDTVKSLPLWMGREANARTDVARDLTVLYPKGSKAKLSGKATLPDSLDAPLLAGQEVGSFAVLYDGETVRTAPLRVAEAYPEGTWTSQLTDWFKRLIFRAGL